jgi:hypothetical protein
MQHSTKQQDTGLTDEQARALEGTARAFYQQVLTLVLITGCDYKTAYAACEAADKEQQQ